MAGITRSERVRKKLFDLVVGKDTPDSVRVSAAKVYLATAQDINWNKESRSNVDKMVRALEKSIEKS